MNPKTKKNLAFFLFILPALFAFVNVVLIPFIMGIVYSLTDWDGFAFQGSNFIGLTNYIEAIGDSRFLDAFLFSFKYAIFMVILVNVIGFAFALMVTAKVRGRNVLRSIYLMPNLIGGLILGFIWKFIFSRMLVQVGMVTGLESIFFNWLDEPTSALAALIIVGVWQQAGYVMIIYIAGIQAISSDMMEAAGIDGANSRQQLFKITIPLMIPSFTINLFVTMSNAMKQYDTNVSLTNGGPGRRTEMVAMNIYNSAFRYRDSAEAQAKAILFFLVIMVITLGQVALTRRKEVQL
ncbi:MAG: sugar ABC transporter permease [Clostridia bacterium]|nr:sugar ABC transporter permease [Clostridia bacterium]NLF20807.1 sugar ABC transporter permease [Clostridiaceae bacterium]